MGRKIKKKIEPQVLNLEHQLRQLVITNEFEPLSWIREEAVAERLGVSRTPLREACARLSSQGLLERIPRRGYRLPDLGIEDLNNVYPVLVALEEFAIRSMPLPVKALKEKLSALNFDLNSPADDSAFAITDYQWHCELVSATSNPVLIEHFVMLYARIARFIHFYWTVPNVEASFHEHQMIANSLADGDIELASALLKSHRRKGLQRIRSLIEAANQ